MSDPILVMVVFLAAVTAGLINAVAGGGTLVSFPVLLAIGIPPVSANVTNTIALCPGYFGGIFAQRKDLASQKKQLYSILPVSILGGIAGGILLLNSKEQSFQILVPYLILMASLLLAVQVPLKKWLQSRSGKSGSTKEITIGAIILLFLASVYGGYFGAGVSVMIIAVLGLLYDDSLTHLNIIKQATSFSINIIAAIYFAFFGRVEWLIVLIMSFGSIMGGMAGGKLIDTIRPDIFRIMVVIIGITVSITYFLIM
jgi:hypothetical protein